MGEVALKTETDLVDIFTKEPERFAAIVAATEPEGLGDLLATTDLARLFESDEAMTAIIEAIVTIGKKHVPDTSTVAGRLAIRALAATVTRSKTAIDKAGLNLTKGWRDSTKRVNEERKRAEIRLDMAADEFRQALTDWEQADEKRKAALDVRMRELEPRGATTADELKAEIDRFEAIEIGDDWDERKDEAADAKSRALEVLRDRHANKVQLEEQARELAELRALTAKAEAERREREEAEAAAKEKEAADRRAEELRVERFRSEIQKIKDAGRGFLGDRLAANPLLRHELAKIVIDETWQEFEAPAREAMKVALEGIAQLEADAAEAEKAAEAKRIADAEAKAAEQAREEADAAAREEARRKDAAAAEEIAEATRRAEQAEADAAAERAANAQAEQERIDREEREAAEKAQREADEAIRAKVRKEIVVVLWSLIDGGDDAEHAAELCADALIAQKVPHTTVNF